MGYPWMKDFFTSPEAKDWAVLRIRPASIRLMTMKTMAYREILRKPPCKS